MKAIFYALCAAICIFAAGLLMKKTWTVGSSEQDYIVVCIGGHEYYKASFANKGFLGIRLDDNAKPVKCLTD